MSPRHHHHELLAEEHPRNHLYQGLCFISFVAIWIPDSFILHLSTYLRNTVPFWVHVPLGIVILILGFSLINRSQKTVFHPETKGVINTGPYARVRHPMYLGMILLYTGAVVGTLSLLSLIPFLILFLVYDKMAAFEERELEEKFGKDYQSYQRRIRRWVPNVIDRN